MTRIIMVLFAIGFIFSNTQLALADEGHEHSQNVGKATDPFRNGSVNSQIESEENSDLHQDGHTDDHSTDSGHSEGEAENPSSESGHSEGEADDHSSESGHSNDEAAHSEEATEGHHGPVVETPPNFKVLGTFGAVNLSFVLIGIWNKWIRRKGV